jgi:hypothetical protein
MSSLFYSPALCYLGKMTMISAILYGYYWGFLRNASFHPYNRWYLLGSALISLLLPFLRLPFPAGWMGGEPVAAFLSAIPGGSGATPDELAPGALTGQARVPFYGLFRGLNGLYILYGVVSTILFVRFLRSLAYLARLSGEYAFTRVEGVRLFQTGEPGTPFSFLNRLFWNKQLPLDTEQGQFIFRHELYHIRQKHTLDLLALESLRCLFWFNPFFHLLVREMKVIHEFLSDRYALAGGRGGGSGDQFAYAEWLVWQSVGGMGRKGAFPRAGLRQRIAHSFFNTHLNRRITMIIRSNPHRPRYISRLMALPLLFLLFCAFAARTTTDPTMSVAARTSLVKKAGKPPTNDLVRFYIHHLRYPETARKAQQEEIIWFTVSIGEKNKLLEFRSLDIAPDPIGQNAYEISVTSRLPSLPDDKEEGVVKTGDSKKERFLDEARAASEKIPLDAARTFTPGKYLFTIVFRLERPAMRDGKPIAAKWRTPIAFRLDQSGDLDQKISQEPD